MAKAAQKVAQIEEIIEDVLVEKTRNWKLIIIAIIVVILALVPSIYFYSKYQSTVKNPSDASKEQTAALVEKVAKLIELPKNETPTIATVADKTKLADQSFFANAQNGDKVLIYSQTKKAILYRPSTNKIIEVAPVNLGTPLTQALVKPTLSPSASPSSFLTPTPTTKPKNVSLLILNGTGETGLASSFKKQITDKITNVTTISVGDAVESYTETLIVDPTGNKQLDSQLMGIVGGEVTSNLPEKEKTSSADVTIIIGEDHK